MTDTYTWVWLDHQIALLTMLQRMMLADFEALEAAVPGHYVDRPGPGPWGLVVDMRNSPTLDVATQAVVKRLMLSNVEAGCSAKAMVFGTNVAKLQSQRLGRETQQRSDAFDSVPEALASVEAQLGVAPDLDVIESSG